LKESQDAKGISYLSSKNGKRVPVQVLRNAEQASSPASKTQLNQQIKSSLKAQGDFETRTKEFLSDPEVFKIAASSLSLAGVFDAKATVDLKVRGQFTNEQLSLLRQAGMRLASAEEIREEENSRQIPIIHQMVWLQGSPQANEPTLEKEVLF